MDSPLLPRSAKPQKANAPHSTVFAQRGSEGDVEWNASQHSSQLSPSHRPPVVLNNGVESWTFNEDTFPKLLPYVLLSISIPLVVMAIFLFRPVASYFVFILFMPSIISAVVFFLPLRKLLSKENHPVIFWLLFVMVFTLAQVLCDACLCFYIFLEGGHGEQEIENRDVFVGASVILCLTHILISLSLFTKCTVLVWNTSL